MFSKMKALCCACILFCGSSVMAAQPQAGAAPAQPQAKASATAAAEKVLGGPITAVNSDKKEITVLRNSVQYPILVTGATQIVSGNQPVDFSSLSVGDKVVVTYTRGSDAARNALTIQRNSVGSSPAPAGSGKIKAGVKAEPKKAEASAAPAPKAELKAEPKKAEAHAAVPAAPKAESKKVEAYATAPAAPKAEVKAEPKKAEAPAAPVAPKAEVKAEPKKAEASAVPVVAPAAPKVEVKK
jgi:hypothetical protein